MKLEFLDDISDGGKFPQVVSNQLIRLYDFDPAQAASLRDNIMEKILKGNKDLDVSSLGFVEVINCNLIFTISEMDTGSRTTDKMNFECALSIHTYEKMVQLIGPFCEQETNGYQWLYDLDGEIDLLFSPGGTW